MGKVVKLRGPDDAEYGPEVVIDADTGEILDEDGKSTGQTLEDLADVYLPPIALKGSQQQLSLDVGKHAATPVGSMMKLKAGKLPISGQFPLGSRVTIEIEVEVEAVDFKPIRSSYSGEIIGIDRIHTGSVEAARTVE